MSPNLMSHLMTNDYASPKARWPATKLIGPLAVIGWPYLSFVYLTVANPRLLKWYFDTDVMHTFFFFSVASHLIGLGLFRKIKAPALKWIAYYLFSVPLCVSPLWASIFSIAPWWFVHP